VQRSKAGERDFGPTAALDYNATVLSWMDRHLKSGNPGPAKPPVRVFVMGANQWREANGWPLPGMKAETVWVEGKRGGGEVGKEGGIHPGRLVRNAPTAGETVLQSNPMHPFTDPFYGRFGAHNYRDLKPGPDVAVFQTEPFSTPLEIIGQVVIELAASATVTDFDLWVQLFDVAPDGTAWNLSTAGTALQRASYRAGGPRRTLVRPGESVRLRMDRLVTANRFLAGHRLRIVITPQFYPLFSVNPQTGAQEFESDSARAGEISIEPGSRLILPVVSRQSTVTSP